MGVPSFSLTGLGSVSGSYSDSPSVQTVPWWPAHKRKRRG